MNETTGSQNGAFTEKKDNHGQSLAAWVTVSLIIVAFAVGTLAVILGAWAWFWGSVALVFVALILGKVLQVMGYGAGSSSEPR
jgi:fatty acid desaturase